MSEFDLIRDYFHWRHQPDSVRVSVGDDAAVLSLPTDKELVVSVDTFNADIHFPHETPPHAVGYKALAVNLSDLAAMGAQPDWFTLAISMPEAKREWISEFARGMWELAQQHGIFLVGGDTTRGPLSITVQVMGFVNPGRALLRSKAQHGDLICVSGTLGDAAAGLAVIQQRLQLSVDTQAYCVQRLHYPTPRNVLADILAEHVHACMDISDGLLADLSHILRASQVGAKLEHARLPFSPALLQLPLEQRLAFALSGGDDYELLFTLPPTAFEEVKTVAAKRGVQVTYIGEINENIEDLQVDCQLSGKSLGYDHFSTS